MTDQNTYQNWCYELCADRIARIAIDCPDQSTNVLSTSVLEEFEQIVNQLAADRPRAAVISSNKPSGFIVGADISEFKELTDIEQTTGRIKQVHSVLQRLEDFSFPTIAVINGFCLGGGLEIALACQYRIAIDDEKTKLGLPEILLGIHPGFAGTVRSIERVGVFAAMDLMLTGRSLDPRRARKIGLVDVSVPERHIDSAIEQLIAKQPVAQRPPPWARMVNYGVFRPLIAFILRRQVAKRASERHYPAPYALIRLWRVYGGDRRAMMAAEARSIATLLTSPTSQNLQRLFFLQERLKDFGREKKYDLTHVHVIGAGTMGGDIAAWCVLKGFRVTLQDRETKYVAPAIKRAHQLFNKRLRNPYRRSQAEDRLIVDIAGDGIHRADVIIEAIIEDLAAKQALFKDVEARARKDAILATNTSSIPLDMIASAMDDPKRLVGIHFFNPVARMQLVEIVSNRTTRASVIDTACQFTVQIERQPLPVSSAPGFLINRILSPYLQEAMLMLDEGLSAQEIDAVARDFGMPMGPLELADQVGLDICLSVGSVLAEKIGGENPRVLQKMVDQRRLGKKTNSGFYDYKSGKLIKGKVQQSTLNQSDIRDRLILRLLNECVACYAATVVKDLDLIDVGMVFGTGFAPFRGGPMHYARERGVDEIVRRLEQLKNQCGERFTPHSMWRELS